MILVRRDAEPDALRKVRNAELPELMRIARTRRPTSDEIDGYRVVASDLWRSHLYKCCYCEIKLRAAYNDVEHYRPKASADRRPGCATTHGYWWLAFTWKNLLFACPSCNRSGKNDQFPLDHGSVALAACAQPPGKEQCLLLDPSADNGVEHIEFVFSVMPLQAPGLRQPAGKHWWPRARGGSRKGDFTIRVCKLDTCEHIELYDDHVNKEVRTVADKLNEAIKRRRDVPERFDTALRLLQPGMPFVGLSYDALRHLVPDASLAPWTLAWPAPHEVGLPPRPPRRSHPTAKR